MKNYLLISILISLGFLFMMASCKQKTNESTSSIDNSGQAILKDRKLEKISALYFNYIVESENPINAGDITKQIPQFDIDRKGILDAEITDSVKLKRIEKLVEKLQPATEEDNIDARIVLILEYNDNTSEQIIIGGKYTDRIYLNDVRQETDNEFLFVIKNSIGFYPWLIGDDLLTMEELKDPTFPKEPFVSSAYYKQYQEALNRK